MTDIAELLEDAGLTGRGGAAFSTAVKVRAAASNRARLIVNACDGEIGAAKDGWVVAHHLDELIEGAQLVAGKNAGRVRYAAHRGSTTAKLLAEAGLSVLEAPDRYVSSEETSLISLAQGGTARPLVKKAPYVFGGTDSRGRRIRPTVVLNAETLWRVSQLSRRGVEWFRSFGTAAEPGPRLMSVAGYVQRAGVYETAAGTPLAQILDVAGGLEADAEIVGVGGLGGVLLTADEARSVTWDTPSMKALGGSLGPGVVTVWNPADCAVEFAAAMIGYGAGETAGQCGPCMFGLPALVQEWESFTRAPSRATHAPLQRRLALLSGRGACHHPDGVARFAQSALRVLGPQLAEHAAGACKKGARTHARLV